MAGHNNDEMGDEAVSPDNTSQAEETENISEEYNQLDSKLDELNSALDFLEQKNDNIHAQLIELLNSSREIRQQLRQENVSSEDSATNSQPKQQES